ncbi:unnamed protein product, partial [Rotaria sp. Silwood1]
MGTSRVSSNVNSQWTEDNSCDKSGKRNTGTGKQERCGSSDDVMISV